MTSQRVERTYGSARAVTGGSGANGLIKKPKNGLLEQSRLKVTAAYFTANGTVDLYKHHDSSFISFGKMVCNVF